MRSDGTDVQRIYRGVNGTPQWSPDGTRILFEAEGRLLVMAGDGGEVRPVADGLELDINTPFVYRWSPDGASILYTRPVDHEHGEELWVAAIDGSGRRLVAEGLQWRDAVSAWSPDGTMVAFVRGGDIWVVSVQGGHERQLTDTLERESVPSWGSA